jgi:peptide/nickel transport system permease protein
MNRYVAVRIVQGMIALLVSTMIIFGLARLTGDPVQMILPEDATPEMHAAMAKKLGLDRPYPEQYWIYIEGLLKGDWGKSIVSHSQHDVQDLILSRFPATLRLAGAAALVSILVALPAGVLAAVKRNKWQDIIAKTFAILGQSIPTFWLGIILIQVFAVQLGWLPGGGYGGDWKISNLILPAITLGYHSTAGLLRLTRSAMLDILGSDFVRLARIKGVSEGVVIWRHALKNALLPVVTFSGVLFAYFLMGSIVTETVFAWPGVGRLSYEAIKNRDFPVIQGIVIIFVGLFILFNLIVDIVYCYLDPRIRYVKK